MDGSGLSAHRKHGEAGFTLVELLVALALFSLLVTVLSNSVQFGLRVWKRGSTHAEDVQRIVMSQDVLRRMIGNIYPMVIMDPAAGPRVDFDGAKCAVNFLANAPISADVGGRFRFKLYVDNRSGENELVLDSLPELARSQDTAMAARTVLLANVDHAEFSYFGSVAGEQALRWTDSWSKRSELPDLIRVRVAFRSGDTRSWPELVVAPRITADVSCVYDPLTMRCRGR